MNHRQRILTALRHQEPDRVPIDFGGTVDTTIQAVAYKKLRKHLGLRPGTTRIIDVYQQVAEVEEDLRQLFEIDTMPVLYEPGDWRMDTIADGLTAIMPAKFLPVHNEDGSQILLDKDGNITAKMPENGHYFDPIYYPLADATSIKDIEKYIDTIENFDKPDFLDKSYEELAEQTRELRNNTDYLIVGFFSGHFLQAGLLLRGWEAFFMDLIANQKLASALLQKLLEANVKRFNHYAETIGPYLDVVMFEDDLGMEDRTLISPGIYRKMVKPVQKEFFSFVKSKCDAFIFFHSDGAIAPFIPDLIEIGVDILNPVQVSCAGMDTGLLKKEFGSDICFWGAGCDSQHVLPFGTTDDVKNEVKQRIDDLAPGGGYIFAPIHNVQNGVPPENIEAMFKTAKEYGVYRKED